MDQRTGPTEKIKSTFRGKNTPAHPRHPPAELKMEVIHRCFECGEDVKSVSEEIGYSRASIYTWRQKYLQKGMVALMNPPDDLRNREKAAIIGALKNKHSLPNLLSSLRISRSSYYYQQKVARAQDKYRYCKEKYKIYLKKIIGAMGAGESTLH
jgi:transposase-like protein